MTGNICCLCMDPVADTHRYVTGFTVLYLCDGCAERMHMERCREGEDRVWTYPTHDMRRRE